MNSGGGRGPVRRRVLAGAGGALAGLLAACGVGGEAGPGGTGGTASALRGTASYMSVSSGTRAEQYRQLAARFQERNPQALGGDPHPGAGREPDAKLIAMAAGGTPPETMFMAGYSLVEFAERGMLEPLDAARGAGQDGPQAVLRQDGRAGALDGGGKRSCSPSRCTPTRRCSSTTRTCSPGAACKAPDATWTWDTLLDTRAQAGRAPRSRRWRPRTSRSRSG